jgi:omega-amidase
MKPDLRRINLSFMSNLRISLLQTAIHWEDKTANLEMLQKKIEGISEKTELIILPEMFSTGFSMARDSLAESMDGHTVTWMRKTAAKKNAVITGSIIIKEESATGSSFYNRMVWMLPDGHFGFYDKRHLFAYGKEDQYYSAGKKRLIASVNGWKINLQICYDLRFPVWIRQHKTEGVQTAPEFDLLIVVANWPTARSHAWRTLLQARAIENQCYVVGVNRTGTDAKGLLYPGESMILGPLGETIKMLGAAEEIYSHMLERDALEEFRLRFPFWQDADSFFIQP